MHSQNHVHFGGSEINKYQYWSNGVSIASQADKQECK